MRFRILLAISVAIIFVACSTEEPRVTEFDPASIELYRLVDPAVSGVTFENEVPNRKDQNILIYDTYYSGAGVAMLDINNDGLEDLYFAGNHVPDRLYLNKGNMQFEDVTRRAGIQRTETWSTGVAVADVNGDGWDDIYICKFLFDDHNKRYNLYYENQRDGTFKEMAAQYKINDPGYGIMANFFDYDGDNDLDLYIANQPPSSVYLRPKMKGKIDYRYTDRLYRNDGDTFTDVTGPAGITNYTFSLSATVGDLNNDGFPDIYLACDYEEPDMVYMNQGNGTFVNVAHEALRHMSTFAMGSDIGDINNDGWMDVFTADMVAEGHYRNKTNMSGMNPEKFWSLANNGYHYQYMFNALHLNNGNGTFSEIAQLAGVSHTDWSWATLFIDMDQDGYKDLYVANGLAKEVRNKDYELERKRIVAESDPDDMHDLLFEITKMAPEQKLSNYAFHNNHDLTFSNLAAEWSLDMPSWTQGVTYGDLDNDGDLDLVLSNVNEVARIYESTANDQRLNNYLVVEIDGPAGNTRGCQARVEVMSGDLKQTMEMSPVRGYMSTTQDRLHFGLGANDSADEVVVTWPDGKRVRLTGVKANQTVKVLYADAAQSGDRFNSGKKMFATVDAGVEVRHEENDYDDYAREILLPYQMSTLGPVAVKGDINGDGLEDMYVGGSVGHAGMLYGQQPNGTFAKLNSSVLEADLGYEDGGAAFFDADGDGDQDLLVASGGNEFADGSNKYADRLYINDGNGGFTRGALPGSRSSSSIVRPFDFDADGDLDVFIGGRQVPGKYGFVPQSILLENQGGTFVDVSDRLPQNGILGMVTFADWQPLMGGDQSVLIVTGEWMPITVLAWNGSAFENVNIASISQTRGFWNRLAIEDIDGDGDLDIVAGNMGTNMKYDASPDAPFKLYADDFDGNGTHDVYLGYYDKDGKCYPVRGRQCSSQQMPFIKEKFESYEVFAHAPIDQVLAGRLDDDSHQQYAEMFESGVFYNNGNGEFQFDPFRNEAQVSPIFGIVVNDFNNDGIQDLLLAGNYYNREVETTRSDAGVGCLLLGSGDQEFTYVHSSNTGIVANKDVRDLLVLNGGSSSQIAVVNNNDEMQFYKWSGD